MAHIKNNSVLGAVKNPVKGDSKLDDPQIARQMTAVFRDSPDDTVPDFAAQLPKLALRNFF